MKVLTVVGARPQFIKAAMVSKQLRKKHQEIIVHTGQHYDYNMSAKFFEELSIPSPDYNLKISGGSHASMTGRMMIALEEVFLNEKPDWLLVYGDTNSTLAASLVAAKLHVKICHVEAGARTYTISNPEEINRICTDHISTLLLTCTKSGYDFLALEGLENRSFFVGDPMYDAFLEYSNKITEPFEICLLEGPKVRVPSEFYYLTCHREENTRDDHKLFEIFKAMNSLDSPTIYPVHPRNRNRALSLKKSYEFDNVILCEPIGYLESIYLVKNSKKVVTDSGGLQREAFFAKKKCITILDFVCWPETMVDNRNTLAAPRMENILYEIDKPQIINKEYKPFGDGNSAKKIVSIMDEFFKNKEV